MNRTAITRAMLLALPVLSTSAASAADWSVTDVQYRYGTRFNDNGASGAPLIEKQLLQVQNASGFSVGRSYFFLLMSKADGTDDKSGDLYSEGLATFSLSKLSGASPSTGLFRDVGLTAGYNFGTRNTAFRPNTRVALAGPAFDFNVPGFNYFNVDVLAYRDASTYRGFDTGYLCGKVTTTYQVTPAWQKAFAIGPVRLVFDGFADFVGAHGTCARQTLTEAQLRLDIGNFWGVRDKIYAGVEVQYWRNKFGIEGVRETVPQVVLQWKL